MSLHFDICTAFWNFVPSINQKYYIWLEKYLKVYKWCSSRQYKLECYELQRIQRKKTLFIYNFFSSIISVKAKSFADREIRYTLKAEGQGAGTFNIGPRSGIVKLAKELDFEDVRQPHIYQLVVTATEDSGGFSTSVDVSIMSIFKHPFLVPCLDGVC